MRRHRNFLQWILFSVLEKNSFSCYAKLNVIYVWQIINESVYFHNHFNEVVEIYENSKAWNIRIGKREITILTEQWFWTYARTKSCHTSLCWREKDYLDCKSFEPPNFDDPHMDRKISQGGHSGTWTQLFSRSPQPAKHPVAPESRRVFILYTANIRMVWRLLDHAPASRTTFKKLHGKFCNWRWNRMWMCYLWMNHIFQQSHTSFGGGIVKEKIFSLKTSRNRKSISMFGAYKPRTKSFYWKSAEKSDKQTFKAFLHPLSVHCPNSKTVIVLDNASIHTCRYIKDFAERNPNIKFSPCQPIRRNIIQ